MAFILKYILALIIGVEFPYLNIRSYIGLALWELHILGLHAEA